MNPRPNRLTVKTAAFAPIPKEDLTHSASAIGWQCAPGIREPQIGIARGARFAKAERGQYTAGRHRFSTISRPQSRPAKEVAATRTQVTLQPGQKGTRKLLDRYGAQLVCVRYHYDARQRKRVQTVELIVEEAPWGPNRMAHRDAEVVGVRVGFREAELQRRVKSAGGRWNPIRRVWEIRRDQALALGLEDRITGPQVSTNRSQ